MWKKSSTLKRGTSKQRNGEGMNKPVKREMSNTSPAAVVVSGSSKTMSRDGAGKAGWS